MSRDRWDGFFTSMGKEVNRPEAQETRKDVSNESMMPDSANSSEGTCPNCATPLDPLVKAVTPATADVPI
jgi:hypothetical protein